MHEKTNTSVGLVSFYVSGLDLCFQTPRYADDDVFFLFFYSVNIFVVRQGRWTQMPIQLKLLKGAIINENLLFEK